MVSETTRCHRDGEPPVSIRWVLLRDPTGKLQPTVLMAHALAMRRLWANHRVKTPPPTGAPEVVNSPASLLASLIEAACYAA